MDLHSAAQYLKIGYRIRRASWAKGVYDYIDLSANAHLKPESLWANDWEIVTEGIIKHFPITYADEVD